MKSNTRTAVQCNDPFRCPRCHKWHPLTDYRLDASYQPLVSADERNHPITIIFGLVASMTCPTCNHLIGEWVMVSPDDKERVG